MESSARTSAAEGTLPIAAYPTGIGTKYQPASVGSFDYTSDMEGITRAILWENLSALMKRDWGKENLTKLRKAAKVGSSSVSDLKIAGRSVGIDAVEKFARVFGVKPYELLMPELGVAIAKWPFKLITRERITNLPPDALAYVEGRLDEILLRIEGAEVPAQQMTEQARLDALKETPAPQAPPAASSPSVKRHPRKS